MKWLPHDIHAAFPFFMPVSKGERFCLFYPPSPECAPRGSILYVHPFAEELNKSRRMVALQARAFAAHGFGVLQIDLYGCGDSSGDLSGARWEIWREDMMLACAWLKQRISGAFSLWGLRLGALLALDLACGQAIELDRVILWHPVLQGRNYLDHFFRLRLANQMMDNKTGDNASYPPPRKILACGETIEVAGYEISPDLAADIDALDATSKMPPIPVLWFEIGLSGGDAASAHVTRQVERWRSGNVTLSLHVVPGTQFWAAAENLECPSLLEATTAFSAS
jgi:exosortase A-associated hydrolase 2